MNKQPILITAAILCVFSFVSAGLVSGIFELTEDRISTEEQKVLLRQLNAMVPSSTYDNILAQDKISVTSPLLGPGEHTIFRARKNSKPIAAIISATAPDGYSGKIEMLVGIYHNGHIAGVRISKHKETPGLGDKIESRKSDWITQFTDKSLNHPTKQGWAVKKLGGEFDQLTGATISPMAVINATQQALQYFSQHQTSIFAEPL